MDKWQTSNVVNVTWVTICSSQHPKILSEISSLKRRAITLIPFTVFPMYVAHSFHHFRLIFIKINMSQGMNFICFRYIHPFPLIILFNHINPISYCSVEYRTFPCMQLCCYMCKKKFSGGTAIDNFNDTVGTGLFIQWINSEYMENKFKISFNTNSPIIFWIYLKFILQFVSILFSAYIQNIVSNIQCVISNK